MLAQLQHCCSFRGRMRVHTLRISCGSTTTEWSLCRRAALLSGRGNATAAVLVAPAPKEPRGASIACGD